MNRSPPAAHVHGAVRAACVSLLALTTACAAAPRASDSAPSMTSAAGSRDYDVRVMSFNIRYGTARDGDDAWPLRRGMALHVIRDFAPLVLGVQEALHFQLVQIAEEFPHFAHVGVGRDDGREAGEYAAILYDARRLRVVDSGTFWLSDTPAVPGSMHWGNRITRIATWALFHDALLDTSFHVFNTHWDHESQPARERSAALILERTAARQPAGAVILMGDFNAGEHNAAYRALLSAGARGPVFTDAFRAVHPHAANTGTFHAFTGDRTGERIDAILASPEWTIVDAGIVHYSVGGRYPSDHFPVTAVLRLGR